MNTPLTWIEISKSAIQHNLSTLKRLGNEALVASCVKGNAYGHGLVEVARVLAEAGVDWLTVALIEEAAQLRAAGVSVPILCVGYIQNSELEKVIDLRVKPFVYNMETVDALSRIAEQKNTTVGVHIKIDTGMNRQGIQVDDVVQFISYASSLPGIAIEGVATHFATADEPEKLHHFNIQLDKFISVKNELEKSSIQIPLYHCNNSAATLMSPKSSFDMIRPGVSLYGYFSSPEVRQVCESKKINLIPSLSLKTKIAQIKHIKQGDCVSYGCSFVAPKNMIIAVLPVGYYDGIDRGLSNNGSVLIKGKRASIIGRVCMNIMMVDVSNISNVSLEDEIVVIGAQGNDQIDVEEIANKINTINYEITTRLRESIPRVVI